MSRTPILQLHSTDKYKYESVINETSESAKSSAFRSFIPYKSYILIEDKWKELYPFWIDSSSVYLYTEFFLFI